MASEFSAGARLCVDLHSHTRGHGMALGRRWRSCKERPRRSGTALRTPTHDIDGPLRARHRPWNVRARVEGQARGMVPGASSDDHFRWEIRRRVDGSRTYRDTARIDGGAEDGVLVTGRVVSPASRVPTFATAAGRRVAGRLRVDSTGDVRPQPRGGM
jgi:hypothetical protein